MFQPCEILECLFHQVSHQNLYLFCLFVDDEILNRLAANTTTQYAAPKKDAKPTMHMKFKRHPLTADKIMRFLGCLLLLSIDSVQNYRQAWNDKSSQHLVYLNHLLTHDRFEQIRPFLCVVTVEEEAELSQHRLKKILPFQEHVTGKCPEFYQPLQKLSTDDRMVKSKARTHFRQYIRKKPTKWGYKYSVLGDPTGYTIDFNIYYGAANQLETGHGLAYDVITTPVEPFHFQGYLVFCGNFYSSPSLFEALSANGIAATGTLRTNQQGVSKNVLYLKKVLNKSNVRRGTGHTTSVHPIQNSVCCIYGKTTAV